MSPSPPPSPAPSSPPARPTPRWRRLRSWWPRRGWRRAVALRRLVAGLLLVLAVVLALAPRAEPARAVVVVAARDLAAGAAMAPGDVTVRAWPEEAIPTGVLADPARAVGRVPVGGVRAGEPLTDVRLLGPEAAASAAGRADAAGVPLRLADPGITALLRPGVRVDVVAVPDAVAPLTSGSGTGRPGAGGAAGPRSGAGVARADAAGGVVVAGGAVVLAVLPPSERSTSGPVVVVALPVGDAARVAATALSREVTVTLR